MRTILLTLLFLTVVFYAFYSKAQAIGADHYSVLCENTPIRWSPNNVNSPTENVFACREGPITVIIHPPNEEQDYWLDVYITTP